MKQQIIVTLFSGAVACFLVDAAAVVLPAAARVWNLDTCFLSVSVGSVQQPDP